MATTPKRLYNGSPSTTTGTLYTVPLSTTAIVKNITVCNTTDVSQELTLYFVPSGGTVGVTNQILADYVITAKDTVIIDLSSVIEASGTINGSQLNASALSVYISGVEVT